MTVFPQLKAPGMGQIPPSTEGKRASRTRYTKQKPSITELSELKI
jgi:hypothetical protein